ncbi:hypothetical protein [Georgenia sp. EYE_87]|uniref:hypothetical protein n=1 Tax=Georgenia sp. EYE_87 TaxID=2853448 RepID=UPI0027E23075|nr:hypothetical protein [Georgenia sp. EYE_87]
MDQLAAAAFAGAEDELEVDELEVDELEVDDDDELEEEVSLDAADAAGEEAVEPERESVR